MIDYLNGKLIEKSPTCLTVDVGGVGYEVHVPLSTFDKIGEVGNQVKVLTYLWVREDLQRLYGFASAEERDMFKLLLSVSGVGPKVALTILSGSSPNELKSAVCSGDIEILTSIPGVGKKTAEKVALELKEKVGIIPSLVAREERLAKSKDQLMANDALLALLSLGYKQSAAQQAIRKVLSSGSKDDLTVEELIREVLRFA